MAASTREGHRPGVGADGVTAEDGLADGRLDLEQDAQHGPVPERRDRERDGEPGQRALPTQVALPDPHEEPGDDHQEGRPAERAECEDPGVEREDVDRDEDGQGEHESPIGRAEQQERRRDDGQGQPADRARVDVGQDGVVVEVDRVRAVEDADGDGHDEDGHRHQVQVAGRASPRHVTACD